MQVITNEKLIRSRARLGRAASFTGLAMLLLALVASFLTQWWFASLASFGFLIVGFVLSQIGIYFANRWVKQPRPDQTLDKILKGFDDRYSLYNYILPAAHVLLAPFGLCVIRPKGEGGKIRCQGAKWRHKVGWRRLLYLFGQEGLGNPTREVQSEVEKLRRFLAQRLPNNDIPIEGVVVFTNPQVDLEVDNPTVPVLDGKQFKIFLRDLSRERPMPASQRKQLAEILAEAVPKS